MVCGDDATITPEFRAICERFRALEARKSEDEASVNFEQAQLIRDARDRLKLPVPSIRRALGLSAQSIHTYRNVAERIDVRRFSALIKERRPDGLPLFGWSIIVQIARLESDDEREELVEKIRGRGWRTRAVEEYVSTRRAAALDAMAPGDLRRPRCDDARAGSVHLVGELASEIGTLVKTAATRLAPTAALVAAVDALTCLVTELARACGRASGEELTSARTALSRCVAAASSAEKASHVHGTRDGASQLDAATHEGQRVEGARLS